MAPVAEPDIGIRVVAGLGNPGAEYDGTRHNVGFMVVDALARRTRRRFRVGGGSCGIAIVPSAGGAIVLIKPLAYMNNSGPVVRQVMEELGASPRETLVVIDDVALPLGTLRFRASGSDGGHNGLSSVISALQTEGFPRLRCGVGREVMPPKGELASFVLAPFDLEEEEAAQEMIVRAATGIMTALSGGLQRAMTLFNS